MTVDELVREARSYLGTPYTHHGRVKGVGVDCVGLLCGLVTFAGVPFQDVPAYGKYGRGANLIRELERHLLPASLLDGQAIPGQGSVAALRMQEAGRVVHCGLVTRLPDGRPGLLHTHNGVGRVVEHGLDSSWQKKLERVFWIPGVEAQQEVICG